MVAQEFLKPQVCHGGGVAAEGIEFVAGGLFGAVGAGLVAFGRGAFADWAHGTAIGELHPVSAASRAVDCIRCDLVGVVHFAPFAGNFFPEPVIILQCGGASLADFAVKAAIGCQFVFHILF